MNEMSNPRLIRYWSELANRESRELYPENDVVRRLVYIFERTSELEQTYQTRYQARIDGIDLKMWEAKNGKRNVKNTED